MAAPATPAAALTAPLADVTTSPNPTELKTEKVETPNEQGKKAEPADLLLTTPSATVAPSDVLAGVVLKDKNAPVTTRERLTFNYFKDKATVLVLSNQFKPVFALSQYVDFKTILNQLIEEGTHVSQDLQLFPMLNGVFKVFKRGISSTEYEWSKFFNVPFEHGLPRLKAFAEVCSSVHKSDQTEIFGGLIAMVLKIALDNEYLVESSDTIKNYSEVNVPQNITTILKQKYFTNVECRNPYLYSLFGEDRQIRQLFDATMEPGDYLIGRVGYNSQQHGYLRSYSEFAIDIDHFKAAIANLNFHHLWNGPQIGDTVRKYLEAHGFLTQQIHIAERLHHTNIRRIERGYALNLFMLMAAMDETFQYSIEDLNYETVLHTGLFSGLQAGSISYVGSSSQTAANMQSILRNLMSTDTHESVMHDIAREVSPQFRLRTLRHFQYQIASYDFFIYFVLSGIYAKLFPNLFHSVRGEWQNTLLDFLTFVHPAAVTAFTERGIMWRRTADGGIEYAKPKGKWVPSDALSGWIPALWSPQRLHAYPILYKYVKWVTPIGHYKVDNRAQQADFPRITSGHYIGLQYNTSHHNLIAQFMTMLNEMKEEVITINKRADFSKKDYSHVLNLISSIAERIQQLAPTLALDVPTLLEGMANNLTNFWSQFNGDQSAPLINYAITGAQGNHLPIIRLRDNADGDIVDIATVLELLYFTETPRMRIAGHGNEKVSITSSNIVQDFPLPGPILQNNLRIYEECSQRLTPYGILQYLTSTYGSYGADIYIFKDPETEATVALGKIIGDISVVRANFERNYSVSVQPITQDNFDEIDQNGVLIITYGQGFVLDVAQIMNLYRRLGSIVLLFITDVDYDNTAQVLIEDGWEVDDPFLATYNLYEMYGLNNDVYLNEGLEQIKQLSPHMTAANKKQFYKKMCDMIGAKPVALGETKLTDGYIDAFAMYDDATFRRCDTANAYPWSVTDPADLRYPNFFLPKEILERLSYATTIVTHPNMPKLQKGVRVVKSEEGVIPPHEIPPPKSEIVTEYSPDLFRAFRVHDKNKLGLLIDGVEYHQPQTFPEMHWHIDNQQNVQRKHASILLNGVKAGKFSIDIDKLHITNLGSNEPNIVTEELLMQSTGEVIIVHVPDETIAMAHDVRVAATPAYEERYLFSLGDPYYRTCARHVSVRIGNNGASVVEESLSLPTPKHMQTGTVSETGQLIGKDGQDKMLTPGISMTNVVRVGGANMIEQQEFTYECHQGDR